MFEKIVPCQFKKTMQNKFCNSDFSETSEFLHKCLGGNFTNYLNISGLPHEYDRCANESSSKRIGYC